jgi:hypothetical protein
MTLLINQTSTISQSNKCNATHDKKEYVDGGCVRLKGIALWKQRNDGMGMTRVRHFRVDTTVVGNMGPTTVG